MRGWNRPKSPSACPFCGCWWLWKNRRYRRTVQTLEGPRSFWVRQWKCAECERTCADRIPGAEKGARYALEVKREAVRTLFDSEQDVAHTVKEMRRNRGWSPSASTVRRAMRQAASDIRAPDAPSSGILLCDEKYVRVAGRKRPALVLRDMFRSFCRARGRRQQVAWVRAIARLPRRHPPLARFVAHFLRTWPVYHTFRGVRGCPKTNNGSEGGIAQLEKHLARLRGFRSEESANGFLALWALHWNYRPIETGPHRGKCPLELAGLDVKGQDWMDCTGLTEE